MTVNQGGRPSKARERIAEILHATAGVVAREGFAGATLSKVAAAVGLQRTLVLHYFGTRDALIGAFIDHAVSAYGVAMLRSAADESIQDRIGAMFARGAYRSREDLVVWIELVALSARDRDVRRRLRDLWTKRWLPDLEAQLAAQFPSASAESVASTAYALACLFEAHWAFSVQGVADKCRREQATQAAYAILDRLSSVSRLD
jgi:AcrR family transcriptional regulator